MLHTFSNFYSTLHWTFKLNFFDWLPSSTLSITYPLRQLAAEQNLSKWYRGRDTRGIWPHLVAAVAPCGCDEMAPACSSLPRDCLFHAFVRVPGSFSKLLTIMNEGKLTPNCASNRIQLSAAACQHVWLHECGRSFVYMYSVCSVTRNILFCVCSKGLVLYFSAGFTVLQCSFHPLTTRSQSLYTLHIFNASHITFTQLTFRKYR